MRGVKPCVVLEIAFDSINESKRHKSGLALRFPRIHRIRWDKPADEADTLENLKKLVQELDLGSQVMFFKDISNDLKNALIAKSNIFVMPSIIHKTSVEGFGIAYVEAAQYGIPSLGGKDGGASDAISHDKTGLICDGNNLDDIYSSLNSMIENCKRYY